MGQVITAFSTKGGVGKTSFTKFFGIIQAQEGKRVLLVDLCENGDVAFRLGYDRDDFDFYVQDWVTGKQPFEQVVVHDELNGVDFLPSNHRTSTAVADYATDMMYAKDQILRAQIEKIKPMYDYIILDNHPTETTILVVMALAASDYVVIPTPMDESAIQATIRCAELIEKLNSRGLSLDYYVLPTSVDFTKGYGPILDQASTLFRSMGIADILPPIRFSSVIAKTALLNQEVTRYDNKYAQQVMDDYRKVADTLEGRAVR